jgi:hypothetical protein
VAAIGLFVAREHMPSSHRHGLVPMGIRIRARPEKPLAGRTAPSSSSPDLIRGSKRTPAVGAIPGSSPGMTSMRNPVSIGTLILMPMGARPGHRKSAVVMPATIGDRLSRHQPVTLTVAEKHIRRDFIHPIAAGVGHGLVHLCLDEPHSLGCARLPAHRRAV